MIIEITLRLLIALVLGGVIGIEREYRSKEAGFRTHFLVALGSALFCIVSQYGFGFDLKDSSRVAAQVVSGIGFLGAGTIIFQKNVVRGLTTAAGLWVTAAIGLACGSGMYAAASIATAIVIIGLEVLIAFVPHIGKTVVELFILHNKRKQHKGHYQTTQTSQYQYCVIQTAQTANCPKHRLVQGRTRTPHQKAHQQRTPNRNG